MKMGNVVIFLWGVFVASELGTMAERIGTWGAAYERSYGLWFFCAAILILPFALGYLARALNE